MPSGSSALDRLLIGIRFYRGEIADLRREAMGSWYTEVGRAEILELVGHYELRLHVKQQLAKKIAGSLDIDIDPEIVGPVACGN